MECQPDVRAIFRPYVFAVLGRGAYLSQEVESAAFSDWR